jgi:predicted aspartyl protease
MIRYKYNQQVAPPAPFVHVTIRRPGDETSARALPAQMDTAADMTVIPWQIVEELQLLQHDEIETLGFGGHVASVTSFLVQLQIHQFEPVTVEALASRDEPHVLLGRDMLNMRRIVLDGPQLILEID